MSVPIDPRGGRGAGPHGPGLGEGFPFAGPAPSGFDRLFATIQARLPAPVRGPIRLEAHSGWDKAAEGGPWVDGVWDSGLHQADIRLLDADDVAVVDTSSWSIYRTVPWGPLLRLHEWIDPDSGRAALACHWTTWASEADAPTVPAAGVLDPPAALASRCLLVTPPRTHLLGPASPGTTLELETGFNVAITPTALGVPGRRGTRLLVAAAAGSGLGRYPTCDEASPVLRRLGGVIADARGNVALRAADCHSVERVLLDGDAGPTPLDGALRLANDCQPCSDCEDFVDVQRQVLQVWTNLAAVNRRRLEILDHYAALQARWASEKACREAQPISINVLAHRDTFLEVAIVVCNHEAICVRDVELRVELLTDVPSEYTAVPILREDGPVQVAITGDGQRNVTPIPLEVLWDGDAAFGVTFDRITPSGQGTLRFRAALPANAPEASTLVTITARTNLERDGDLFPVAVKAVPVR